jgi:colicin import membrane protein
MRGPSLQKTTIISFTLHLTAFLIILLIVKQSNRIILPAPYTVDLVSPEVVISEDKGKDTAAIPEASKASVPVKVAPKKKIERVAPHPQNTHADKAAIEEKIAVLSAKKRVEKMVTLRSHITLKASDTKRKSPTETPAASSQSGKGAMFDEYYAKIMGEIKQQWIWTDTGKKDLEAIISIKILKDGTTLIKRVEKSSGNNLFDRSAVRALTKANPLPPPPYEMEIGVRFYP